MKLTKIFGIVLSLHVGVILLVMFQPGCQTADKKEAENPQDKQVGVEEEIGSFNSGLSETLPPVNVKPKGNELKEPTRPVTGELFVPGIKQGIDPVPLPSIINADSILSNSLNLRPSNLSVYKIVKGDTLWGIARKNNVPLKSILTSNPNLSKDTRLKIGQEIMISDGVNIQRPKEVLIPVETLIGGSSYTVRGGDSLSRIARTNSVSLSALMDANGMDKNSILKPGQVLIIPGGSLAPEAPSIPSVVIPSGSSIHTVKKGDNLTRIASIHGTTVKEIMEWNNLSDAGKIRIGQALIVSNISNDFNSEQKDANVISVGEEPSSVQDFFKGIEEEKPIIDVPEQP